MRLGNIIVHFNLAVLNAWFLSQQHQDHLETYYKCKFSSSTSDLLTREVVGGEA